MNIGRLDRKIVIQQGTETQNTFGEFVTVWTTYHTTFASVHKAGGNEKEEASRVTATNLVKFKIRFYTGITEDMIIQYNGNDYDILEIQELGREGLWLKASRKYGN